MGRVYEQKRARRAIGEIMTMFSEQLLANKPKLVNKLVEVEVLKYKALKLDASE